MVYQIATALLNDGCTEVLADLPGFRKPDIRNHTPGSVSDFPDIVARKEGLLLFDIQADDSLEDPSTYLRWKQFSGYARKLGALFCIVVPQGSLQQTEQLLRKWEIDAEILQV